MFLKTIKSKTAFLDLTVTFVGVKVLSALEKLQNSLIAWHKRVGAQTLFDLIQMNFDLTRLQTSKKYYVFATSTAVQ